MAYTPGPWLLADRTVYALHDPDGTGDRNRFSAQVQGAWLGAMDAELAANARMIAAAPELYEALKLIMGEPGGIPWAGRCTSLARAAIAKAEGR